MDKDYDRHLQLSEEFLQLAFELSRLIQEQKNASTTCRLFLIDGGRSPALQSSYRMPEVNLVDVSTQG